MHTCMPCRVDPRRGPARRARRQVTDDDDHDDHDDNDDHDDDDHVMITENKGPPEKKTNTKTAPLARKYSAGSSGGSSGGGGEDDGVSTTIVVVGPTCACIGSAGSHGP